MIEPWISVLGVKIFVPEYGALILSLVLETTFNNLNNIILDTNSKQGKKPTPVEIPKYLPVRCKAIMPPIIAKGTFAKTK